VDTYNRNQTRFTLSPAEVKNILLAHFVKEGILPPAVLEKTGLANTRIDAVDYGNEDETLGIDLTVSAVWT
jgi:hypothetical protein